MIVHLEGGAASELMKRLVSWSLFDTSGQKADRFSVTLDAFELPEIPKSGDSYLVKIDGEFRGKFEVTALTEKLFPPEITINMSPAKFNVKDKTAWREVRRATYPPSTIKDVVTAVMVKHGYEVRVDPEFASIVTPHMNQTEETDRAFISRLAKKYRAIAKPVNGLYVFGAKGSLKTLSGGAKKKAIITPEMIKKGTAKIEFPSNNRYKGAKATFAEPETGNSGEIVVGESPYLVLKQTFKNSQEATERASAELIDQTRKGQTFTGTANTAKGLFAESVMLLEGFTSPRSRGDWSVDEISITGSRTEVISTQITATRPK